MLWYVMAGTFRRKDPLMARLPELDYERLTLNAFDVPVPGGKKPLI
jgi:hypothetical protein